MNKPWIQTKIDNHCEQTITIQPTPEFDGIELYFSEMDDSNETGAFYISKEELPVIIQRLQDMMNYVIEKNDL